MREREMRLRNNDKSERDKSEAAFQAISIPLFSCESCPFAGNDNDNDPKKKTQK